MKITYLVRRFPVYSETFIIDQIIGLMNRGFDVTIIALELSGETTINSVNDAQLMKRVIHMNCSYGRGIKEKLRLLRDILISLSNKYFFRFLIRNIIYRKRGTSELAALLQKKISIEGDAIIAHFGTNAVLAMKMKKMGVMSGHLLGFFHGFDLTQKSVLSKYLPDYQDMFLEPDFSALPISNLWKEKLISLGCPAEKVTINRMGINTNQFQFKAQTTFKNPLKILTVARHTEKKGITYALDAILMAKNKGLRIEYNIVGTGPLLTFHKDKVKELGLGNQVNFLGVKSPEEIKELLYKSDLFLLPSITAINGDMEGVPVSLMEAMACGIICLSTFHSGIPELIENNKSGFLVTEKSASELCKSIIKYQKINNHDELINHAREKVELEFNQDKIYNQLSLFIRNNR